MIKFTMFLFLFKKSKYRPKRTLLSWPSLFSFLTVFFVILSLVESVSSEGTPESVSRCDKGCYNGDCVHVHPGPGDHHHQGAGGGGGERYRCECWEGWRGEKCELCGGKVKLQENGSQTWLAEAVGNYTTNMKCTWVVEAQR